MAKTCRAWQEEGSPEKRFAILQELCTEFAALQEQLISTKIETCRRHLYEAALLEVDQELLPRRVRVAKMAIHSRIIKVDDAGGVWVLMDALHVLDDLLRMHNSELPRRG